MWSKQAESRGGKHAGKTASKSHRKRNKNDKKNPDSSSNGAPVGKKNAGTTTKLPPGGTPELGGGRGGGNNNNKTKVKGSDPSLGSIDVCDGGSGPDIIKDIKATLMTSSTEVHAALAKYDDDGTSEVVLRKKPDDGGTASTNNDPLKRYSDSIVNDNCVNNAHENDHRFVLSRTHSGFFLTNAQKESESKEKKRRFSGLFRHSIGKTSSNDDHSKTTEFGINENGRVITLLDVKDKKSEKKSVKRSDSKAQKDKTTAAMEGKKPVEVTTPNSVLKRVRSRIYKTKTENGVSVIPSMPDIREQKEKKSKKTDVKNPPVIPEVKRNTLMDFRMFRQTSNLEYVRPKTMMPSTPKKTLSIDNSMMMFDGEKPTLNKSKSSSAINLSLLRTRRKFLEGKKHQNSTKQVEDEFDFITFDNNYKNSKVALLNRKFGSQDFISNLNNNVTNGIGNNPLRRTSCAPAVTITESKPGNPVTRTPSDRRPDAVREESRNHDTHGQTHDNENDNTSTENSASLPASTTGNKQRHNNNINRSESVKEHSEKNRKQKRNVSDPLHNSDAFMLIEHQQPTTFQQHSGSSSSSSLNSSRSFETQLINAQDSDLDVDPDPPNWKSTLTEEQLSGLHAKERARQDVINELFHTERTHVRNLKVLDQVFLRSIVEHKAITETEQNLVFANLPDILSIHTQFNVAMKKKRVEHPVVTEIGDLLLSLFDGELGARFCVAVSKYCEKQQQGLELISEKRKKDSKFDSILSSCEKNNLCRRLPLQGLIPQEMQRTTKYKLLVERLIAIEEELLRLNSEKTAVELDKLNLALEKIKHILNSVNEAAKLAYNECRLEDIRNHMDIVVPGRSDSSTQFNDTLRGIVWKLVQDGAVTIKRQNKTVPAHMLLLKEAVILLHKEGDRFILKSFLNNQAIPPVIKISNLICRPNAADMTCLFLLSNAQNSQMYEIQCADETERKKWFKYLTDASEPYKSRDGKNKRMERNHDPEEDTTQDLVTPKADSVEQVEPICEPELATAGSSGQRNSAALEEEDGVDTTASNSTETEAPVPTIHSAGEGGTVKLTATDWPLIQPSEVQVAETSVHTAEPILTPLEKIKRKDDEIKKALADKEVLVADLLSIPRENYRVIADMVSEKKTDVEPYELVLASVNQVHELISAVKDSLNITEADGVLATGGKHPACNSNEASVKQNHVPSVPASKIQNIAMTLMSQLTILLSSVKQRDEESELMRKEMHRLREQLHEKCNLHPAQSTTNHHDSDETVHHESTQSGDLESIEESPIETETT